MGAQTQPDAGRRLVATVELDDQADRDDYVDVLVRVVGTEAQPSPFEVSRVGDGVYAVYRETATEGSD